MPEPPQPQNDYVYQNGAMLSSRIYDPSIGGYKTNLYSNAQDQEIENLSRVGLTNALNAARNMKWDSQSLQPYVQSFVDPQKRALNESYNQAVGGLTNSASAAGMQDGVGFQNYKVNQIERNRAQGLADIEAAGKQYELNLPSQLMAPYLNQANLFSSALGNQQAFNSSNMEAAMQGANSSNQFFLNRYGNDLNRQQIQFQQQMASRQQRRPSFFGKLLGGF